MALIKCFECGKQVSEKASACPSCGCPVETMKEQPISPIVDNIPTDNNKPAVSVYGYDSTAGRINHPAGTTPEIPTGLYWATAILGFPIGIGIALGCYFGANSRINKGDYAKAQKYINNTKIACWLILVPCSIAVLIIVLAMCSMM